ncbi:unnamed protein product [Closterium sp. Naga37s-1]|nr:unnamed protein product [Closterium sp. Naga37s-1]
MFSAALKRFAAAGLHAIALDLPNSGESCRATSGYADSTQATQLPDGELTMVDVANLVLQAAHGLHFVPPFDIVGHQVGATVALHIAAELPHIVRRIALWGIPMLGFMERGDVLREESPDADYQADLSAAIGAFITTRFPEQRVDTGVDVPWQLKVRTVIDMLQTYERRPWLSRAMAVTDHADLLKRIDLPVLCMAGERELMQKATRKAALLCKNGEYVELEPAGRDVVDEMPDEYSCAVLEFLLADPTLTSPMVRASCSVPAGLSEVTDVAGMGDNRQVSESGDKLLWKGTFKTSGKSGTSVVE